MSSSKNGDNWLLEGGRESLVDELKTCREAFVQACWAYQDWSDGKLYTTESKPIEVLAPGWLNKGPGPDFTEARVVVNGEERWGDVEIHTDEQDWWRHNHHTDPKYNRVILHVVLWRGLNPARLPTSGETIPVFHALPHLSVNSVEMLANPEEMLDRYENLPGKCGLRSLLVPQRKLHGLVAQAAEERARKKAKDMIPLLQNAEEEQALFQVFCKYLGYRPNSELFLALSRRYPMKILQGLLELPLPQARTAVLSRWFGSCGLLEIPPPATVPDELKLAFDEMRNYWRELGEPPIGISVKRSGSRPWNSPERRMVGLFYHLWAFARDGWFKGWLDFLRRLDVDRNSPEFKVTVLNLQKEAFSVPEKEPWLHWVNFNHPPRRQGAQLIGKERVVMLMANAVLPFFLAWARNRKDKELEKVLYRLYLVLPPEGKNKHTRFMEKRLTPFHPIKQSLRSQQGLIQIHKDFCLSFDAGCSQCKLPDMITPSIPHRKHSRS